MSNTTTHIRVSNTNAEDTHGNTIIKPGDLVKYKKTWCRVVEVSPDDTDTEENNDYLYIYRVSGMHKSIERTHAEAITKYKSRNQAYSENHK